MKMRILSKHAKWVFLCLAFLSGAWGASAQTVTGMLTDEKGEALIGATIQVKGVADQGTITDADGSFSLNAKRGDVLVFNYVGYRTQELLLGSETRIQVQLELAAELIEEVVVVGYGASKRSDLTGSVASVKGSDLTQVGTVDVLQALQGRAAGVEITSQSGRPGAGSRIRIRGVGTINNSDPLYVVDGFQTGDISFINPNDIESIEVLKDASATAIYGSRGANGVVLISTKKGKEGKPIIEFSAYGGVQNAWRKLDMLSATDYAKERLLAYQLDNIPLDGEGDIFTRLDYVAKGNYQGTDWQDLTFGSASMQNYSLSISGGNQGNRYNLSAGYFSQNGIVRNTQLDKYFIRFNNDLKLTNWLRAGLNVSYAYSDGIFYEVNYFGSVLPTLMRIDPVTQAWDPAQNNWLRADLSGEPNLGRLLEEQKNLDQTDHNIVANVYGEADLMEGLTFRTQYGVTFKNTFNKSYYPEFFIEPEEQRDQSLLQEYRDQNIGWMWTNYLTWTKQLGAHNLTLMAGAEAQERGNRSVTIQAFDVPANEDLQYISSAKEVDFAVFSGQSEEALLSYFGRLNYSFKDRYLLTATLRRDGSSRFLDETRWGLFPSFSLGWNLGREAFISDLGLFSSLKLRGGWGQVGNQNSANNYGFVTTVEGNQLYVFGNQPVQGIIPVSLSNPELQWETTEMLNIGLDAEFWDGRIGMTLDWFDKKTLDMIVQVPIPLYVGAFPPRANAGDMRNRGIELGLNYRNFDRAFTYDIGFNITRITNEVINLGGGEPIPAGAISVSGNSTLTEEGYEIAYFYGYRTDGVFNNQAELDGHINAAGRPIQPGAGLGDVKYLDLNEDGTIDAEDRTYLGSATPDFSFGVTGSFGYKGFDLRFFLYGVQGNEIMNGFSPYFSSTRQVDGRWTPATPDNNLPRPSTRTGNNLLISDLLVEDGSYLRLRNLQLGYTLPTSWLSSARISRVRVYVAGDNIWTKTNYSGFDPEVGEYFTNPLNYGVDIATYPIARTWRMGVDLRF